MINFTAGAGQYSRRPQGRAQVQTIVTSRAFIEKAQACDAGRPRRPNSGGDRLSRGHRATASRESDKLRALMSRPAAAGAAQADDPAVILFTSGSEGTPKGVTLSHRNMLANAAQAAARIDFGRSDKVFNVLPIFHCFGLTVGLFCRSSPACRFISIPRRCTTASCRNWSTPPTPRYCSAPIRSSPATPARPTPMTSARCAMSSPAPSRQGNDARGLGARSSACDSRRLWRHRDRAGAGAEHADVQQVRHGRPPDAGHGKPARSRRRASRTAAGFTCADQMS